MAGPVVDDQASNLSTLSEVARRRLQVGLWVMLAMAMIAVMLQPVLAPREGSRAIGAFMMIPTALLAMWLIRQQRVRAAVMTLVFGSWLVVTLNSAVHGGVFAAGTYAYPILVVICGWTLGMRVTLVLAILTIATEAMLTIAGIQGLISQTPAPAPWQWAVHAVMLVGALGFVGFSIGAYDDQIKYIRALSAELALKVADIEVKNREQEQQTLHYRTLLDAQSDAGLGLFMVTNRRITFTNNAACRMLGYSREEMLALPSYTELLDPDDLKRVAENHERRVRGESFDNRYDVVMRTKSGERREGEITVAAIPGADATGVLIILADITERKQVDRELSLSREMFSHVFQSNPTAVAISRVSDGRYLDVNPSHCRLFGWSREEAVGRSSLELGHWPGQAQRESWTTELRKTGKLSNWPVEMRDRNGRRLSVAVTAEIFFIADEPVVLSFVSDYTDLRQAEAGLRRSEERFGRVFQASPVATVITRLADGAYLDLNEAFTRQFGWVRSEVLATTAEKLGVWPDPAVRARWIATLHEKGAVRDFDVELHTRSGERRQCIISAELIDFDNEQCLIALIHDISDRHRAEDEVRRLNSELEERVLQRTMELTEANQELESFAYSISHDLRAPLRGIDGFSRLLQEEYEQRLDTQGREYLARVRRAAQRMGTLIDDLLELSRVTRQEMKRQPVDLSAICLEVVASLRQEQPERAVDVSIEPDCTGEGDPQLLRVLVENLLGNAWKYTRTTPDARIEFGVERNQAEDDVFFIRDNGVGFDMAYANKLFAPFQRLHSPNEFEGSGIGLASVWRVVRRHGGQIWAMAEIGHGATFRFTLATAQANRQQ
ncbi:MAG: PAS/PAC sensor signal transduction histidine kinase [Rhodocyclaceae bacterium]|nr:MAG: PAS/PAC sensor signal transduction histidine kinase [Rhodocyclaceae bacterium]TND03029.1 MAG: PAS/PAC sensor signal transduction histidine kinase [Rhodocyclaceae bacterium]